MNAENKNAYAVIIMGSGSDKPHCEKISENLKEFGIRCIMHVASAHKVPGRVFEIIEENRQKASLYITVAGRSNALSGVVEASTEKPVIASPVIGGSWGWADIFSTLRMPSGVAPLTVLSPDNTALAAAKVIGIENAQVREKVQEYQQKKKNEVLESDRTINSE